MAELNIENINQELDGTIEKIKSLMKSIENICHSIGYLEGHLEILKLQHKGIFNNKIKEGDK